MSPEEWAFKIGELIKEAEADGLILFIDDGGNLTLDHFGAYSAYGKRWVNGCEVSNPVYIEW